MATVHEESLRLEGLLGVAPLIRVNGKRPLDTGWTEGPRSAPSEWRRRLREHQGNTGLVTGNGIVVVDADLYHPEAADSLDRLHDLGLPRQTVTVITGGGGRHLYYRTTERIGNGPLQGFPGIDIKADGGFVVVPPSVHPITGNAYEWEHGWSPADIEPAALPESFVELFNRAAPTECGEMDERDEAAVNLLVEHFGAHAPAHRGTYIEVTRPGKERRDGASATIGAVGRGVVRVWSSNWKGLPAGTYGLTELRRLAGVEGPRVGVPELAPPDGFRWWVAGDEVKPTPILPEAAFHGPLGEYLAHCRGNTEGHPAGIGFTILAYTGMSLGRSVAYRAGREIVHHPNLWGAFVGPSSSGAKGISWDAARYFLDTLDPTIVRGHTASGFGSGQALVDMLGASDEHPARDLVVQDHELSALLVACKRDGSTLSEELRKGFDLQQLESRTRTHGERIAADYFLAALGSITATELVAQLDSVAIMNGFGNRWLWLWSELSDLLPFGGHLDQVLVGRLGDQLAENLVKVYGTSYSMDTPSVRDRWESFYIDVRKGRGSDEATRTLTARHHVHASRLSVVYAAIDGATTIDLDHLEAAIGWCDYSLATVERIFGGLPVLGDAAKLLAAIRDSMPEGLTGTEQRDLFGRNRMGEQMDALRSELERAHLIHTIREPTNGAPRLRSLALSEATTQRPGRPKPPGKPS